MHGILLESRNLLTEIIGLTNQCDSFFGHCLAVWRKIGLDRGMISLKGLIVGCWGIASSVATYGEEHRFFISCNKDGLREGILDSEDGSLEISELKLELMGLGFTAQHPFMQRLYVTRSHKGENQLVQIDFAEEPYRLIQSVDVKGQNPAHLSLNATGQMALTANYSSGSVNAFSVDKDGTLSEVSAFVQHDGKSVHGRQKGPHPHFFGSGPQDVFAFCPDLGTDEVTIYRMGLAEGSLEKVGAQKLAPGAGPRHLAFEPQGRFAYVLGELDLTVTRFPYDPEKGLLDAVDTVSAVADDFEKKQVTCAEIKFHPSLPVFYTSQRDLRVKNRAEGASVEEVGRNSLSAFRVAEDGSFQRIESVNAQVCIPRSFDLSPDGKWLLVAGQSSNELQVFEIEKDGTLTAKGEPVPCPNAPKCVLFE